MRDPHSQAERLSSRLWSAAAYEGRSPSCSSRRPNAEPQSTGCSRRSFRPSARTLRTAPSSRRARQAHSVRAHRIQVSRLCSRPPGCRSYRPARPVRRRDRRAGQWRSNRSVAARSWHPRRPRPATRGTRRQGSRRRRSPRAASGKTRSSDSYPVVKVTSVRPLLRIMRWRVLARSCVRRSRPHAALHYTIIVLFMV